ncbi:uncharacterized protein CC84DRAFT_1164579 [Paraphaeosphaeria sporulosa]|uniref:Uncharacterized protein n=1 Tax=Paraphaeosphaeria sporulosa TaxID=1460663 RepID=A0A177CG28_9PLEO|nr:uncharacterized protein CC84DRAFT_1164579 [Paraphaeosphaeria sporulosa]OAG06276.1 hypothetical protein CC84DRAFT_1164579 [Paraphaeosphaeria sporulosa]
MDTAVRDGVYFSILCHSKKHCALCWAAPVSTYSPAPGLEMHVGLKAIVIPILQPLYRHGLRALHLLSTPQVQRCCSPQTCAPWHRISALVPSAAQCSAQQRSAHPSQLRRLPSRRPNTLPILFCTALGRGQSRFVARAATWLGRPSSLPVPRWRSAAAERVCGGERCLLGRHGAGRHTAARGSEVCDGWMVALTRVQV